MVPRNPSRYTTTLRHPHFYFVVAADRPTDDSKTQEVHRGPSLPSTGVGLSDHLVGDHWRVGTEVLLGGRRWRSDDGVRGGRGERRTWTIPNLTHEVGV